MHIMRLIILMHLVTCYAGGRFSCINLHPEQDVMNQFDITWGKEDSSDAAAVQERVPSLQRLTQIFLARDLAKEKKKREVPWEKEFSLPHEKVLDVLYEYLDRTTVHLERAFPLACREIACTQHGGISFLSGDTFYYNIDPFQEQLCCSNASQLSAGVIALHVSPTGDACFQITKKIIDHRATSAMFIERICHGGDRTTIFCKKYLSRLYASKVDANCTVFHVVGEKNISKIQHGRDATIYRGSENISTYAVSSAGNRIAVGHPSCINIIDKDGHEQLSIDQSYIEEDMSTLSDVMLSPLGNYVAALFIQQSLCRERMVYIFNIDHAARTPIVTLHHCVSSDRPSARISFSPDDRYMVFQYELEPYWCTIDLQAKLQTIHSAASPSTNFSISHDAILYYLSRHADGPDSTLGTLTLCMHPLSRRGKLIMLSSLMKILAGPAYRELARILQGELRPDGSERPLTVLDLVRVKEVVDALPSIGRELRCSLTTQ